MSTYRSPWENEDEKFEFLYYVADNLHPTILAAMYSEWNQVLPTFHPNHKQPPPIDNDDMVGIIEKIKGGAIKHINEI